MTSKLSVALDFQYLACHRNIREILSLKSWCYDFDIFLFHSNSEALVYTL